MVLCIIILAAAVACALVLSDGLRHLIVSFFTVPKKPKHPTHHESEPVPFYKRKLQTDKRSKLNPMEKPRYDKKRSSYE